MKPKPKSKPRTAKEKGRTPSPRKRWRVADLPPRLQAELRDRVEQADRGEDLIDADKAMDEAERMADDIVGILTRSDARRPGE